MKVYVDEMPKDCIDCPCESEYYCNLLNEDVGCCKWGEIHKNCPLQLLADHDKKVVAENQSLKERWEKLWDWICDKKPISKGANAIFKKSEILDKMRELELADLIRRKEK